MIKWIKPSGVEIETNDEQASIDAANNLGWKLKKERKTKGVKDGNSQSGSKSVSTKDISPSE